MIPTKREAQAQFYSIPFPFNVNRFYGVKWIQGLSQVIKVIGGYEFELWFWENLQVNFHC